MIDLSLSSFVVGPLPPTKNVRENLSCHKASSLWCVLFGRKFHSSQPCLWVLECKMDRDKMEGIKETGECGRLRVLCWRLYYVISSSRRKCAGAAGLETSPREYACLLFFASANQLIYFILFCNVFFSMMFFPSASTFPIFN